MTGVTREKPLIEHCPECDFFDSCYAGTEEENFFPSYFESSCSEEPGRDGLD